MPSGLLSLSIGLNAMEAGRGAQLLAARGLRPRLLIRRRGRGLLLKQLDAELFHADLESPESLESLERAVSSLEAVTNLGARATFEKLSLPKN